MTRKCSCYCFEALLINANKGIIVPGTIEEKILDIHKIKRLHIDGAIDKKCFKPGREGNVPEEEFKYLIGLAKLA